MRKLLLTIGLGLMVALIGTHAPAVSTDHQTTVSIGVYR